MDLLSLLQSPTLAEAVVNASLHSILFSILVAGAYSLMKSTSPYVASGSLFTVLVLLVALPFVQLIPNAQIGSWWQFKMTNPAPPSPKQLSPPTREVPLRSSGHVNQLSESRLQPPAKIPFDSTMIINILGGVWGLGIMFMLARSLRSQLKLKRLSKEVQRLNDPTTLRIWNSITTDQKAGMDIHLAQINQSCSPFAFGLLHPTIVMPRDMIHTATPQEIQDALLHELNHITSRDLWFSIIQRIALAIYWWNPIVCWIEQQYNLSREKLCDIAVIQRTGNAKAYATTLVTLADRLNQFAILPNSTHRMATSFSLLEERIKSIAINKKTMKTRRTKQLTWTACTAAILTGLLTLGIKATWASPHESVAILKSAANETVQLSFVNDGMELSLIGPDGQTHSLRLPISDKAKSAELQEIIKSLNTSSYKIDDNALAPEQLPTASSMFDEDKSAVLNSNPYGRSRTTASSGSPRSKHTYPPASITTPAGAFGELEIRPSTSRSRISNGQRASTMRSRPRRSPEVAAAPALALPRIRATDSEIAESFPVPAAPPIHPEPAIAPVRVKVPALTHPAVLPPVIPTEPQALTPPQPSPLLEVIKRIEQRLNALENQQKSKPAISASASDVSY